MKGNKERRPDGRQTYTYMYIYIHGEREEQRESGGRPSRVRVGRATESRAKPPPRGPMEYNVPGFKRSSLRDEGPLMEAGSFDGARRARPVRQRVRAGHGATGRALHRYTYTYMYIYTRRERRPERRAEREKNRGRAAASLPKYDCGRATES